MVLMRNHPPPGWMTLPLAVTKWEGSTFSATYAYVGMTQKEVRRAETEQRTRNKELAYILDPNVSPKPTRRRKALPPEEELREELVPLDRMRTGC